MNFKGRTVLVFVLLTMVASVLATLVLADRLVLGGWGAATGWQPYCHPDSRKG